MLYLFCNCATSILNDGTRYICSLICTVSTQSCCTTIFQQPYITSGNCSEIQNTLDENKPAEKCEVRVTGTTRAESTRSFAKLSETDVEFDSHLPPSQWLQWLVICGDLRPLGPQFPPRCLFRATKSPYEMCREKVLFHTATCVTLFFHLLGWRLQRRCPDTTSTGKVTTGRVFFNSTNLYYL